MWSQQEVLCTPTVSRSGRIAIWVVLTEPVDPVVVPAGVYDGGAEAARGIHAGTSEGNAHGVQHEDGHADGEGSELARTILLSSQGSKLACNKKGGQKKKRTSRV